MQKIQDLQDKLFFECKNILDSISKISTKEELLIKHDLFLELTNRITVLKFIEKNEADLTPNVESNEILNTHLPSPEEYPEEPDNKPELEEEVIFNNELNEISIEETPSIDIQFLNPEETQNVEEEVLIETETPQEIEEVTPQLEDEKPIAHTAEETSEPQHKNEETLQEEIEEAIENIEESTEENIEENESEYPTEKKIKLAKIKPLSHIEPLFNEETLEEITKQKAEQHQNKKARREFALDLNDRIAFSKHLFGGSQVELNEVVKKLNSFEDIDSAKEFLSDMYYEKNWDKVDEIAQRLWYLVEDKFM